MPNFDQCADNIERKLNDINDLTEDIKQVRREANFKLFLIASRLQDFKNTFMEDEELERAEKVLDEILLEFRS